MTKVLNDVAAAAVLLKQGKVVAFPTETVYGLGACIFNEAAIKHIFTLKNRPADNPLIAHISSLDQLSLIAVDVPQKFYQLAEIFFPGPLTLILKKSSNVPFIATAGQDSIAVRMPNHPLAQALIAQTGPLVAPSANLSGKPSATTIAHVLQDFEGRLEAALDGGPASIGIESTVLSLYDKPVLLRPGSITTAQIEEVLGEKIEVASKLTKIRSPGMKYRHYAPIADLKLVYSFEELEKNLDPLKKQLILDELTVKNLYASLRYADTHNYEQIIVLCDAPILSDAALMNRLLHATQK
jgi:L-threonylcarbamoyladenylate synthase